MPDVRLARVAPRIIDATGRYSSPLNGVVRTVSRPGDRWGMRLDYENLQDQDRARMEAFVLQLRGAANRAILGPRDWKQRGSFDTAELAPNNSFNLGTNNWTATGATFTAADRIARVANSGAAAGRITSDAITIVSGQSYAVRALSIPGNVSNWKFAVGTTAGASDYIASTPTNQDQLATSTFTASGTVAYISLYCNTSVSGDFVYFSLVSLTRCGLVNGGAQTGSVIKCDAMGASGTSVLLPGDWVSIGGELKRVTVPLDVNSSNAYISVSPPMRTSPGDNTPVINKYPTGRFIMSGNESGWQTEPGRFATSSFDLVEAV